MMKDLSPYSFSELYDMINHINPYKYPEKIEQVKNELEIRKERGEVPSQLVPNTNWEPLKFWKKSS